jgi:GNAT superfamily N-acetyltransferase
MLTIERATLDDLDDVVGLLNGAAEWLRTASDSGQWGRGFTADRIRGIMAQAAGVWIVRDEEGAPVATMTLSADADPDFWTPDEASDPALYLSKLARDHTNPRSKGLGALMLRWALDHAASVSYPAVRLDAWRTNSALQSYYLRQGWRYIRTVDAPGRNSGALFEHPTRRDPEIHRLLPAPKTSYGWFVPGVAVEVTGQGRGKVVSVGPWPETVHWASEDPPEVRYFIRLEDGTTVNAKPEDVTEASEVDERQRCAS